MDNDIRGQFLSQNRPFLTAKDVSEILGVTLNHVYRMVRLKQIPSIKIGRFRRFRALDTLIWLEEKGGRL